MLMRTIMRSAERGELRKVLYMLVLAMGIIGVLPNTGSAGVIPADQADQAQALRTENIAKIKATLERKEIAARLADYGLTPEEVSSRLDRLTDEQAAEIAADIDRINAGGDTLGVLLSIALLVLLVLLILHLLGYIDLRLPKRSQPPA